MGSRKIQKMGGEGSFGITLPVDELRRVGAIQEIRDGDDVRKEVNGEQHVWVRETEPGVWKVEHLGEQSFPGEAADGEVLTISD